MCYIKLWNKLSVDIRLSKSLLEFGKQFKTYFCKFAYDVYDFNYECLQVPCVVLKVGLT